MKVCWLPNHEVDGVGVEHGGDVLHGELVGGVGDEEAGLAHGAVPDDHTLDALHGAAVTSGGGLSSNRYHDMISDLATTQPKI